MKIALLGGGTMGVAFARAWLRAGIVNEESLTVIEALSERRSFLLNELGCKVIDIDQLILLDDYEVLFLAVKPQDLSEIVGKVREKITRPILIISIMAGISLNRLRNEFGVLPKLVRCMPNLAVQVGRGVSAYLAEKGLSRDEVLKADEILASGGTALELWEESLLDGVTAIAGSGPAYLYYFLDQMITVCKEFGFTKEDSESMIYKTMEGALTVWRETGIAPSELQRMVTSKGGTTEAALNVLSSKNVGESFQEALRQAQKRAKELGKD